MAFLDNLKSKFDALESTLRGDADETKVGGDEAQGHSQSSPFSFGHQQPSADRFHSFAPIRSRNDAKWYVDGCSYMWAVSVALEEATESIWILDWWLSPELYLRRPPSANLKYRVDRMLLAAAERGVKVNIIIYKEVSSVLTCEIYHFFTRLTILERGLADISSSMFGTHEEGIGAAPQYCRIQTPRPPCQRPRCGIAIRI